MSHPIAPFDTVALVTDLPDEGLLRGQVGAVVEQLEDGIYEVEFVDEEGTTYALATLRADQVMRLIYEPQQAA